MGRHSQGAREPLGNMRRRLAEHLLLALSRAPHEPDLPEGAGRWDEETALSVLRREFPDFDRYIDGKRVVDWGCGDGWQSVAMLRVGASYVVGVDTNPPRLSHARALATGMNVPADRVAFVTGLREIGRGRFDLVISQDSVEHFADPAAALGQMASLLSDDGRILLTFGPPWLSPYGSHMFFFTRVPWVNVLFSEATVMRVRARFRSDGACRYEDVEGGLNRMTVARFERLLGQAQLIPDWLRYTCVPGTSALSRVPGVRELVITRVTCVLRRLGSTAPSGTGAQ